MRSAPVADEFDAIRARRAQIREEEIPRCPMATGRTLYDCLRSSSACSGECPLRGDWLGPEQALPAAPLPESDGCCY